MSLETYGFEGVGERELDGTLKSGIRFRLREAHSERALYAFVVDDRPRYIGVCERDTTTLEDRMKRYQRLQGAGQNKRIAAEIRACLSRGQKVRILALVPSPALVYL